MRTPILVLTSFLLTLLLASCEKEAKDNKPVVGQPQSDVQANSQVSSETVENWKEEYAYGIGLTALTYAYPWYQNAILRYQWVAVAPKNQVADPYMAVNEIWNASRTAGSNYRGGGGPNTDTLYSIAWIDLTNGPILISVPEMGDRYYVIQITSFDSDQIGAMGSTSTGSSAGTYAIIPNGWKGALPSRVNVIAEGNTPWVFLLGRTYTAGPDDWEAAHSKMTQYRLTPLTYWGQPRSKIPINHKVMKPADSKKDPLGFWITLNAALSQNPPQAEQDKGILDFLASIDLGPGKNVRDADPSIKQGLTRAVKDGMVMLKQAQKSGMHGNVVNRWQYSPSSIGKAGIHGDYLLRSAIQSMTGYAYNLPQEATYLLGNRDHNGEFLNSNKQYTLRFTKEQFPKVKQFWSITLYQADGNLTKNPINRYAIRSTTKGLVYGTDGSLTIYIQNSRPDADSEAANWLPSPQGSEEFNLYIRAYGPDQAIVSQQWAPPPINMQH